MIFWRVVTVLVVALPAVLSGGRGLAAEKAEPVGPPLSAAPRPAARPSVAPGATSNADEAAATYDRCMTLTKRDPAAARTLAEGWQGRGGGHPADHCLAAALFELKQYKEAADRFEKLGQAMVHGPNALRAQVLGQAAQAWLLAGNPGRAYATDSAALNFRPDDPELLVDRAEIAGSAGWYDKAIADLDRVLAVTPSRVDALVYRAAANRALGKLDAAQADADKAVSLAPDAVPGLLERGNIRALRGDVDGARQDWSRVAKLAPGTQSEAAAKANMAQLDAPPTPGQRTAKPAGGR